MSTTALANVIPLGIEKPKKVAVNSRFRILEFVNPSGSTAWRVTGSKRDGKQVRENFKDLPSAQCRQVELETEYLRGHTETAIRATKLTPEQLQLAEVAFIKLGDDWMRILDAVDHWKKHGNQSLGESPRIDDAVTQFAEWLKKTDELRDRTKDNLRVRVTVFANSIGNVRVSDITPDMIYAYLEKRNVGKASKENDRRVLSRFFGWCIDRPRRWIAANPARKEKRERRQQTNGTPEIMMLKECEALLKAAQKHRKGRLVPYTAVCLFGGLRPFEAQRLTWEQVNLADNELRLEGWQTKTGRPRVVSICPTLKAWLEACKGKPFFPENWRKDFDVIKAAAGYGGRADGDESKLRPWPGDVMRHTAISHYFRKTGSYGQTAEQFGNSEAIIKRHYQGRVSTDDTKKFYALLPQKGKRRAKG